MEQVKHSDLITNYDLLISILYRNVSKASVIATVIWKFHDFPFSSCRKEIANNSVNNRHDGHFVDGSTKNLRNLQTGREH